MTTATAPAALTGVTIVAPGTPAPQGSKRAFKHRHTGRVVVVEQQHDRVKAWRDAVTAAAQLAPTVPTARFDGPVLVGIIFALPRPKSHYRTGRHAHELRPDAPRWPTGTPDLSKLARSTEDALTDAGVLADDSRIVREVLAKVYADDPEARALDGRPGAVIEVRPL